MGRSCDDNHDDYFNYINVDHINVDHVNDGNINNYGNNIIDCDNFFNRYNIIDDYNNTVDESLLRTAALCLYQRTSQPAPHDRQLCKPVRSCMGRQPEILRGHYKALHDEC